MGRRSRRTEHIGPPDGAAPERQRFTEKPLCGGGEDAKYGSGVFHRTGTPDGDRTCGKCQALHYGALLREQFPTLEIVKASNVRDGDERSWKEYRGVHEVRIGGVLRGYVCSENGWGHGYTAHRATNNERYAGRVEVETYDIELPTGRVYTGTTKNNKGETIVVTRKSFGSKEHAAYGMAVRILGRAIQGWAEFPPPMEPAAYMVAVAEHARQQAERKENRRLETIASMGERATALHQEREQVVAHIEALRGINSEYDPTVEALRFAIVLAEKDVARIDAAIASAHTHRTRAVEGKLDL